MKNIMKFLKPFAPLIVLCILMLIVRTYTDLSLPSLMSDIVNNGIQMGGITEDAPKEISQDGMELVCLFMTEQEGAVFREAYTAEAGVYVRQDFDNPDVGESYARATYGIVLFLSETAQDSGVTAGGEEGSLEDMDITRLYPMMPLLAQMPKGTLAEYGKESTDIALQISPMFTKLFYKELGIDTGQIQSDYILKTGGWMIVITLIGVAAQLTGGYFAARVGAYFSRDMRRAVFAKVESFSSKEFDKFSTASLITRTTNDITQLQMLIIMALRILIYAPIMGVGGVVMAIQKSVSLSWIIAVAVLVMIGVIIVLYAIVVPKFTKIQDLTDKLNMVSRENLSGMLVIRAFGNEEHEEKRFDEVNTDYAMTNRSLQRNIALVMPLMTILMNVVMVAIIWMGGHAIAESKLLIGDMMAFMQYGMQVIMSFLMVAMMFIMIPRAAVSARRINEVLDSETVIVESQTPKSLDETSKTRTVEFNDVTFRYGRAKEPVLRNISFTAKPGETVAFIGATGSGKSSLVNLVPRFYDVTEGSVTIDGVDVRDLTFEELRSNIGYVPQKGVLFSGDISDNIKYGKEDADEDEIWQAIEIAQAKEFVGELEDGLAYGIAQGGTNVSGGQRQRLAMARALVREAPIYIFDDSFSALDFKTDAALRRALKKHTSDATVMIVAQRVSTIMQADQIIVLDDGEVVGKGTHKQLIKDCQTYREIAESQLSKEEM